MSGYILLALAAVFFAMIWFCAVRDAYDEERRKIDPEYPKYHATLKQTLVWWWRSRIQRT